MQVTALRLNALLNSDVGKYALHFRCSEKADKGQAAFGCRGGCSDVGRVVLDVGRQRTGELQTPATKVQNLDEGQEPDFVALAVDQRRDHVCADVALGLGLDCFSETQLLQQSPTYSPLDARL